ncbi:MAG: efflux RND transporter periplasmic adaptor subunit [Verrucomicrobiota bacterium]
MKSFLPVFLSFSLFLTGCSRDSGDGAGEVSMRLNPVPVVRVEASDSYPSRARYVGEVEARQKTEMGFEIAGTLETIYFEEGDKVEKGELLAEIDTSRLDARKAELVAGRAEVQATLDFNERKSAREERLVKSGAVSAQQLDATREARDRAEASLRRIAAQVESVEVDLNKSQLRAPYEGTIAKRMLDSGAIVSQNQPVFEIIETGQLEIRVSLPNAAVENLEPGNRLTVTWEPDHRKELKVTRILPTRLSETQTIDIILAVPADAVGLRDGDTVEVEQFREIQKAGFFLPRDALTEGNRGLWTCYLVVKDEEVGGEASRLEPCDLEIIEAYADRVFVRGGLQGGDLVLAAGLQKVVPGQRVRAIEKTTNDEPVGSLGSLP